MPCKIVAAFAALFFCMVDIHAGTLSFTGTKPAVLVDSGKNFILISSKEAATSGINFKCQATPTNGKVTGYLWQFPGGSPQSSRKRNPGTVLFPKAVGGSTYICSVGVDHKGSSNETCAHKSNPVDQINVVMPSLMIYAGNEMNNFEITNKKNNKVIIGEQINLKIDTSGLPEELARRIKYKWHLPSDAFYYFDDQAQSNPLHKEILLTNDSVTFYLSATNSNDPVSCDILLGTDQTTIAGTLNVVGPTALFTGTHGSPRILDNQSISGLPGISFNVSNFKMPSHFSGAITLVQVIKNYTIYLNSSQVFSKSGLDNNFPYPFQTNSSGGDIKASDTPAFNFNTITKKQIDEKTSVFYEWDTFYNMYLMFLPKIQNACWVPIYEIDWYWYGSANYNYALQTFLEGSTPSLHTDTKGPAQPQASPPQWTQTFKNAKPIPLPSPWPPKPIFTSPTP